MTETTRLASGGAAATQPGSVRLLKLRRDGMFSNVNEVVEQLRLAEAGGYRFVIDWSASCYLDPARPDDPWNYYFEPCFAAPAGALQNLQVLPGGAPVACTRSNVITPRLEDGKCNPLLLPADRQRAHELITRYLHLKPDVAAQIDAFQETYFQPQMIGLHIRGAGRLDGGSRELRRRYAETSNGVPLGPYFRQADEALRLLPDAGLFVCSDSASVIAAVQERYGDRAVAYPAQRSDFGEMHAGHKANAGLQFSPSQLGLDVISEAWLLARTDLFVHGNSNVANFVLCAAPALMHGYVQA